MLHDRNSSLRSPSASPIAERINGEEQPGELRILDAQLTKGKERKQKSNESKTVTPTDDDLWRRDDASPVYVGDDVTRAPA